jgi:acetyl esterase
MVKKTTTKHRPFYRKKVFVWSTSIVVLLVTGTLLSFRLSPWPGALVIRTVFDRGGSKTLQALEARLPDYPVTVLQNQEYRKHDKDALLDVYIPDRVAHSQTVLPVVIWTHGGAWLSGNKQDAAPYFERLADQGFIVVALNYSLAPGKKYPTAIHQLNDAYAYIQANAAQYHIDTHRVVLAGDSAGAQLSSQMAAIITNPEYARDVAVKPSLAPSQLAGVILFCGIYKVESLTTPDPNLPKIVSWGDDITVWAYTGSRGKPDPLVRQMSAYYHVTREFPALFISGGNGDPLTSAQSVPFAEKLTALKVDVTTLFYAKDHAPSLPHEYQFTLNEDGERAFTEMTYFLRQRTSVVAIPSG